MQKENEKKVVVTFGEDGYWTEDAPNPDDNLWIRTGWRVRSYDGVVLIKDKDRGPCLTWLDDNNFKVCPDGEHYEKITRETTPRPGRYAFNGNEHSLEAFDDEKFERGE